MNGSASGEEALANASREEMMSALFGHLVIQNTNMALMFLGKVAHPQTGETVQDFNAARMFIDQLEMLEVKTKGNLTRDEDRLLQQSLTHLRLAFVEAVEQPAQPGKSSGTLEPAPAASEPSQPPVAGVPDDEAESRKRFSKKY